MTTIAIYTRLSLDRTNGAQTATFRQEQACRAFAAFRGWEVADVFEDVDVSAYDPSVHRPRFRALQLALQKGAVDGVLVWKLDRLVRRPSEFEKFWALCERKSMFLASVT